MESHSKGILNTLAEFRNRFQVMIEEHNNEVKSLEIVGNVMKFYETCTTPIDHSFRQLFSVSVGSGS